MGVSFKISRTSTRHKPKPMITESTQFNENSDNSFETSKSHFKDQTNGNGEDAVAVTGSSVSSGREHNFGDDEVSFILNLYPDGYSIVKASEIDNGHTFQDGLKLLRPYDRTSEGLFSAIESGRLPGGILDDIPCKFVEGAIMCEVRDYRKCVPHSGLNVSSPSETAIVSKVSLKMSLENIVKDIPSMADDSWTYGDLMEVESRILNALQPKLCLDPVPRLDRLCQNPASKIDLGIVGMRKKRLRQIPEVTVTSNNRSYGKKICIGHASESTSYGDVMSQRGQENVISRGPTNQRTMHDPSQSPVLPHGASPAGQNITIPCANDMNPSATVKVVNQESQLSPHSNFNKRGRLSSSEPDGLQHQQDGSFMEGFQRSDMQLRNPMLQPRQNASGVQYGNPGMQKYPQLVGEGVAPMDGVKLEKAEPNLVKTNTQMEDEGNHMDPRVGWNNLDQQIEKDPRKEDQFSKRKPISTPRLSAEMSYGSMGTHYGAVPSALGQMQREKSRVTSVPAAGRASSGMSLGNDPMQYQQQAQLAVKRRPNSLPKTTAITGVVSPVSVNNMGGPMNASSPSISTPQLTEHNMLERFAKIEVAAMRHQLNRKKNKVDEFSRKPRTFSAQELLIRLVGEANNECKDDSREMSKSVLGGHMNVCKIRIVQVQPGIEDNMTRLILSEKPNDGTVAMHYGDLKNGDYLNSEDHMPTLPNTHWADLLAAQFCALVIREGGYVVEQLLQTRGLPVPSDSQSNVPGGAPNHSTVDARQYTESAEGKPVISHNSHNSTANVLPSSGMLPPGNSQPLQMSQGHVPGVAIQARPQKIDPQQPLQQQPQQHQQSPLQQVPSQFQRSPLMLPNNSMPQSNSFAQGSNLPAGNHMSSKSSPLPMLQQPNQLAQRRMMMGHSTAAMGMGPVGNNMGLGGLNNAMGMGGAKGMGSAGISAGMGPMSGVGGNMVQNPMGLGHANAFSQHLRAGTLSPQVLAAAQRLNILRNRSMLGGAQSSIAGMSAGTRHMQPGSTGLSMLSHTMNRGTIGQMQRSVAGKMAQMGMANLIPGMNAAYNQQQLQQLQQLQQQPRQNVLPQQEATSPLQGMVSSQQVSSPSTMGNPLQMNQQVTATPQQQASSQQMSQRGPMSPPLSSGPVHPMSADACPASPALSSQTLGSVGSMSHSLAGGE